MWGSLQIVVIASCDVKDNFAIAASGAKNHCFYHWGEGKWKKSRQIFIKPKKSQKMSLAKIMILEILQDTHKITNNDDVKTLRRFQKKAGSIELVSLARWPHLLYISDSNDVACCYNQHSDKPHWEITFWPKYNHSSMWRTASNLTPHCVKPLL
jgi:hypothetical protein